MKRWKSLLFRYQDVFFPIFDVLLNGFNFFMHIYISWFISLNEYSILNAMLSFLAILFVMGISMQVFTTKEVAKEKENSMIASDIFALMTSILIILNVIMIIFSSTMMKIMRTDRISIILIMLIFDINLLLSFYRGLLQSQQMFLKLNINFYIEVISKLIFIIIILPLSSGPRIPLIGILFGMILSLIYAYFIFPISIRIDIKKIKKLGHILGSLLRIIWSNFFLYYLTSISLLIANYYIGERAGLYAVSLKFSQLIMAVGFSVITVIVSYSSKLVIQPKEFSKYIHKWLLRFSIGGILILLGYQFLVRHLIVLLFGPRYAGAKELIVLQAFGYVMLTFANFIISELIIMNQRVHIYFMAAISLILTLALIVNHQSIKDIIFMEIVSYSLLFAIVFILFLKGEKNGRRRE